MKTDKTQIPQNTNEGTGRLNKLAYRDGYLQGRNTEHRIQEDNRIIRENNSAATGLLYGISITALIGFIGGAVFLLTHQNQPSTTPVEIVPVPNTSQPQTTQKETTIIERTVDKTKQVIPVPQSQSPAPDAQGSPSPSERQETEPAENEGQDSAPQP